MSLQDDIERLTANLVSWTEHIDPCRNGHVAHDGAAHNGRTLVHSQAGGFGADWDLDEAIAYIDSALKIGPMGPQAQFLNRHVAVWGADGRMVAFEAAW